MSASAMWAEIKANIAAITPYQGTNPSLALAYRDQVGNAFAQGIIDQLFVPVAWNGTSDRVLGVGQFTSDSFSGATSIPLHIASGDGQIYEIYMSGTYTVAAAAAAAVLYPNNTSYASSIAVFYENKNYTASTTLLGEVLAAVFRIDTGLGTSIQNGTATFWTSTANKKSSYIMKGGTTTAECSQSGFCRWNDTTTVWSSLGTIVQPQAWTGTIVCKRVA